MAGMVAEVALTAVGVDSTVVALMAEAVAQEHTAALVEAAATTAAEVVVTAVA